MASVLLLILGIAALLGTLTRCARRGNSAARHQLDLRLVDVELAPHIVRCHRPRRRAGLARWARPDDRLDRARLLVVADAIAIPLIVRARARALDHIEEIVAELDPHEPHSPTRASHRGCPFLAHPPRGVGAVNGIIYTAADGRRSSSTSTARREPTASRRPAILQIHGGGWVDRRQARAGPPAAEPPGRQRLGRLQRQLPAQPAAPRCPTTSSTSSARSPGSASTPTSTASTPTSSRHRRLGRRPPHRADGAHRQRPATSPASRTPTPRVQAAVPFYGVYDFTRPEQTPATRALAAGLEPLVVKAKRRATSPRRSRRASPLDHVHADAPPFFVDPRRQRHARPGARTPAPSSSGSARCRDEPVLYAEMHGAQHAFDVFPSCPHRPGDRGRRAVPADGADRGRRAWGREIGARPGR